MHPYLREELAKFREEALREGFDAGLSRGELSRFWGAVVAFVVGVGMGLSVALVMP